MPHRPIFFCHIPKTAGTSLRTAFERAFEPDEIVPQVTQIRQNGGLYPTIETVVATLASNPVPVRLLRGHYHYSLHEALDDPVKIVVLREPVARTISALKHEVANDMSKKDEILAKLDRGVLPIPDNHMTRFLSGSMKDSGGAFRHARQRSLFRDPIVNAEEQLREAMDNLKGIDILAVTERMDLVEEPLMAFGAKMPKARLNKARIPEMELNERQMETIREHNALDVRLYRAALDHLGLDPAVE